MNDDWPSDIDIAEANRVPPLETDEKIHSWIRSGRGEFPDRVSEARIVGDLTFSVCHCISSSGQDGRVASDTCIVRAVVLDVVQGDVRVGV
jgi:hypothetical protein